MNFFTKDFYFFPWHLICSIKSLFVKTLRENLSSFRDQIESLLSVNSAQHEIELLYSPLSN